MNALASLAPYVRDAQQKLAALKLYAGKIDGQFGPKMFAAVEAFQKAKMLQVDGVIGDNTWAALDSAAPLTAWNVKIGPAQLAS
jgi:peptidoglycan hydrolase-like protein with peptidoglycan-binding domain